MQSHSHGNKRSYITVATMRGDCCHLCTFVGWLLCQQDYTKTAKKYFHKTCMADGPQPGTFGVDQYKGIDTGFLFSFSFTL